MTVILRVLIVDDEQDVREVLRSRFARRGFQVREAASVDQAQETLEKNHGDIDVVLTDLKMPGRNGLEILKLTKIPCIIMTGHGDKESAIEAVALGAFSFFEKPFDLDAIELATRKAAERNRLVQERDALLKQLDRLVHLQERQIEGIESQIDEELVGDAPSVRAVKDTLRRLALKPEASTLILGESGSGKEVIARELHRLTHGNSTAAPFVPLNCAAIPSELLESELFGHEKGSFSGAQTARLGLAEATRHGTLFLDEIGDMDIRLQAKLLRLLQERKFRRVGSNKELSFDGRIVAATHRNLEAWVKQDRFREDLYFRLSVIIITSPPLRERREDLAVLISHIAKRHGLNGVAPEVLASLTDYRWPGNIRELNNWLERASILSHTDKNGLVVSSPRDTVGSTPHPELHELRSLEATTHPLKILRKQALDLIDEKSIRQALQIHPGNISAAAKLLGLDRKNLGRRMKELGINSHLEKKTKIAA